MSRLKNGDEFGVSKPHVFYNPARKLWTCFHWRIGYVDGTSIPDALANWLELSGLANKVGS